MAENQVRLKNLKPGVYVAQPAKKVCRTEWTETGITLFYDDGTSQPGDFEDAVLVIRTAADEAADAGGGSPPPEGA